MKRVAGCFCSIVALGGLALGVFMATSGRAHADEGPVNALMKLFEGLERAILGVPAAAPQGNAGIPNNPALQAFEKQFEPAFKRMYVTELHFLRVSSQTTRPQYDKIAEECKPAVTAALKQFAKGLQQQNQGIMMDGPFVDPRRTITDELVKSAKKHLSAAQVDNYKKELDQRLSARKHAMVLNLVLKMDQVLFLTPEQRDQLREVLASNWNNAWNHLQWLQMDGAYFPPMPDSKITPLLTQAQKKVWNGVQKEVVFFGADESVDGGFALEEVWDVPPAQKNESGAVKKSVNGKEAARKGEKL
jgi:hypothetical protein